MPTQRRRAANKPAPEPVPVVVETDEEPPDTSTLDVIDDRPGKCKTANVDLDLTTVTRPLDLADSDRVRAAGVLMLLHLYQRMGFWAAIPQAQQLLDEDKVCLDFTGEQRDLLNAISCWPRLTEHLSDARIAEIKARVLGISQAGIPESERNTTIGPLMGNLVERLHRVCHPGKCHDEPSTTELFELQRAYRAVRFNLTMATSTGAMLTIREMNAIQTTAVNILDGLAEHLYLPCHLDGTDGAFRSVMALVGGDLNDAGVDLTETAEIADAWQVLFSWLSDDAAAAAWVDEVPDELCFAAATLRPARDTARFALR